MSKDTSPTPCGRSVDRIVPADAQGIELMSIGFFIKPDDALLWRGAMAVSALKQMIHQTKWGPLDFLLLDLPPRHGRHPPLDRRRAEDRRRGDRLHAAAGGRGRRGARRGAFRNENIAVPVAGIVENMAWFTPEELPDNRYYLFGRGGARRYAEEHGIELLGEIPLVQSIMEGRGGPPGRRHRSARRALLPRNRRQGGDGSDERVMINGRKTVEKRSITSE